MIVKIRYYFMFNIVSALLALSMTGCYDKQLYLSKSVFDIRTAINNYYTKKYPDNSFPSSIYRYICHSNPRGPIGTFVELTEYSETTVLVTSLDLCALPEKTCRIVIRTNILEKREGISYSSLLPITEYDIRELANTFPNLTDIGTSPEINCPPKRDK